MLVLVPTNTTQCTTKGKKRMLLAESCVGEVFVLQVLLLLLISALS